MRILKRPLHAYSLAEAIVAIAVFSLIAGAVYQASNQLLRAVALSKATALAVALANEEFEIAHNLPFSDVGNAGGIPDGNLPLNQTLTRGDVVFSVRTTVRSIDDPFDGTIGGTPNDLSPEDYKIVEVVVSCTKCKGFAPLVFNTNVAPKGLEGNTSNGALFVRAFDANGQPISGASVRIVSVAATGTPITIDDITGTNGLLQLVDIPPKTNAYRITVSKSGYSTNRTYPPGGAGNPTPSKPDSTVLTDKVTQVSFVIDRLSTLNISTTTPTCTAVPSVPFTLAGAKLIGTPNVLKFSANMSTDGSGQAATSTLEWDTYTYTNTSGSYDLAGTVPLSPFSLAAGATQNLQVILSPVSARALLINVKDASTQLPVPGANVTITKSGCTGCGTLTTGRGFLRQTDWSSGSGQADMSNAAKYFSDDGNVDVSTPAGDIKLRLILGLYPSSGTLTSSAFDTGSVSNFYDFTFLPTGQPAPAGQGSVRFQIATNNDDATWNYRGPDGTAWTYYTATNTNISAVNNGNRYLRYKTYLSTAAATSTPDVSDIAFTFTSACVPPGQVLFNGLGSGTYTVTATKAGYQNFSGTVSASSNWQSYDVVLQPS